jgi:hypothetical protein
MSVGGSTINSPVVVFRLDVEGEFACDNFWEREAHAIAMQNNVKGIFMRAF